LINIVNVVLQLCCVQLHCSFYYTSSWPHLRCDTGLGKLSLCYSIVYHYTGAQRYEQFLQVDRLYQALMSLDLGLKHPSASVSLVFTYFWLHLFLHLLMSWPWWDWPLTWLTNHHPSVLWHCWLRHLTRKIVPEMTYNVSSGTSNSTVPYRQYTCRLVCWLFILRMYSCKNVQISVMFFCLLFIFCVAIHGICCC